MAVFKGIPKKEPTWAEQAMIYLEKVENPEVQAGLALLALVVVVFLVRQVLAGRRRRRAEQGGYDPEI